MRSIQSWLVERIITRHSNKINFTDKKRFARFIKEKQIEKPYVLSPSFMKRMGMERQKINGMDCYIFNQKKSDPEKSILYLHGGGYVNQPLFFHWIFLRKMAVKTGAKIYVPIYPKAPNHDYKDAFDKVLPLYEELSRKPNHDVILMGDSAGGGFALALAQLLLEKDIMQPRHIILISPWLDLTMENPAAAKLEKKDPILGIYGLIEIGKIYARETDTDYFLLSPINGKLTGLGEITLFVGTHEIFLPDARKLESLAAKQGVAINYYEYPKMNHGFPLYPIPEGRKATKQIAAILSK